MPRRAHGEGSIYRLADGRWVAAVRLPNARGGVYAMYLLDHAASTRATYSASPGLVNR